MSFAAEEYDRMRNDYHNRAAQFAQSVGYFFEEAKYQCVLGPPLNTPITFIPPDGSEIFAFKLPIDVEVSELLPFFSTAGKVYKIRIMMHVSKLTNKGYAFVMYHDIASAQNAVSILHNALLRPDCAVKVTISLDNKRLFIGGILNEKSRDEVWRELQRHGVPDIVDVIMYRSYSNRAHNRGFVFVEFTSHKKAAEVRSNFKNLKIFGIPVVIDWSVPIPHVREEVMNKVTKIYLRNLPVSWTRDGLQAELERMLRPIKLQKVHKFKDYAFVHFFTRADAEEAMDMLEACDLGKDVEITWAKPATMYNKPWYRSQKITNMQLKNKTNRSTKMPESTHRCLCNHVNHINSEGMGRVTFGMQMEENTELLRRLNIDFF